MHEQVPHPAGNRAVFLQLGACAPHTAPVETRCKAKGPLMGIDIIALIKSLGYLGVWGVVFAESGIIFCFFFPGDSLLFTAGFLASQNILNIWVLVAGTLFTAITGNMLGYAVGKYIGLKLFSGPESRFLKRKHLEMTQRFYNKHGAVAVISARFMPIIRTFVPFLAGVAQMDYKKFMLYTVTGAFVWVVGLTFFGYFFGKLLPPEAVDKYLLPIIVAIIILSVLPSLWHIYKERKEMANEAKLGKSTSE
jgi:membrane-associated protein